MTAAEMGRKRMSTLTAEERKDLAQKAARARWAAQRLAKKAEKNYCT